MGPTDCCWDQPSKPRTKPHGAKIYLVQQTVQVVEVSWKLCIHVFQCLVTKNDKRLLSKRRQKVGHKMVIGIHFMYLDSAMFLRASPTICYFVLGKFVICKLLKDLPSLKKTLFKSLPFLTCQVGKKTQEIIRLTVMCASIWQTIRCTTPWKTRRDKQESTWCCRFWPYCVRTLPWGRGEAALCRQGAASSINLLNSMELIVQHYLSMCMTLVFNTDGHGGCLVWLRPCLEKHVAEGAIRGSYRTRTLPSHWCPSMPRFPSLRPECSTTLDKVKVNERNIACKVGNWLPKLNPQLHTIVRNFMNLFQNLTHIILFFAKMAKIRLEG